MNNWAEQLDPLVWYSYGDLPITKTRQDSRKALQRQQVLRTIDIVLRLLNMHRRPFKIVTRSLHDMLDVLYCITEHSVELAACFVRLHTTSKCTQFT